MIDLVLTRTLAAEDLAFLRGRELASAPLGGRTLTVVDLFAGCGGLSMGVIEGARRAGLSTNIALAVDSWDSALAVYRDSLGRDAQCVERFDLSALPDFSSPVSASEELFVSVSADVDLLIAGPPCQGHSALNNRTRHDDERNGLYMTVPRVARLISPRVVVIENVPGVSRDRRQTLERSLAALQELGYKTSTFRVDLSQLGAPQRRKRHVTVGVRDADCPFELVPTVEEPRPIGWALADLQAHTSPGEFDKPSAMSPVNRERIDWLFDNDAFDLPNHLRPKCHQTEHSYKSMYGRLRWDQPAQTITSGFGSMGQGRFVHPRQRRTITPHEAARLQFLPDAMRFESVSKRTELATMIGNVAPPALTMTVVQALVSAGLL